MERKSPFHSSIDDSLMGTIDPSGNTWEIPEINFNLWPEGEYEIKLEGCDESGVCVQSILFEVNNSHLYAEELVQPLSSGL
ncbi:MAG: hypothetical protein ACJZ4Z_02485 [Candidatus Thalassarchaeaceae archaeon]